MLTITESDCARGKLALTAAPVAARGRHDRVTALRAPVGRPEVVPSGYRVRRHRGTLGCGVGDHGDDGPPITARHGGPGV